MMLNIVRSIRFETELQAIKGKYYRLEEFVICTESRLERGVTAEDQCIDPSKNVWMQTFNVFDKSRNLCSAQI